MQEFKSYHPIVNLIYFVFSIGFSCTFLHPVCLIISLFCIVLLKGKELFKKGFLYLIPLMLFTALLNPLFNHRGVTVICFLPSGNPLTAESIIYGLSAALMLICVILWFSYFTEIFTSDKFLYLFGKIIPSLSMVLSMTLRFVPLFLSRAKTVINAQKCIGNDISRGNIVKRTKTGLSVLGILITWALESSIDTADSMKSRGFGLSGRTAFSVFTFGKRDKAALFGILILGLYVLIGSFCGAVSFQYFPYIEKVTLSFHALSVFIAYFILLIYPVILKAYEVRKWKS